MEIKFKKCSICNNIVWTFNEKEVKCCDKEMNEIKANSVDASFEKHIPTYEIIDNKINITVDHVMEEKHYIMWVLMTNGEKLYYKEFKSGEDAKVTFDYIENATIYSYCNLHSLWMNKVEII